MARPRRTLSDEQIKQLPKLAGRLTLEQLADFYEMSEPTLRAIITRDKRVSSAYKKGRAAAVNTMVGTLFRLAKRGNAACVIFYLKTQAGWRERDRLPDVSDISKLSDSELEQAKRKLGLVS